MFVTNWISTTKIQKISEITNFFRHYFLSRTEVDNGSKVGLKAQKLLDQGIALDIIAISKTPCKGVLDVTYDTPSLPFTFPFGR